MGFVVPALAIGIMNRPMPVEGDLLPSDLWMVVYDYGWSGPNDQKFLDNSQSSDFSNSLSRKLSIQDLLNGMNSDQEKGIAKSAFAAYGLSEADAAGTVQNAVNIRYSSQTLVIGRGINKNLSLFLAAPQVSLNIDLSTKLDYQAEIKNMIASLRAQGQNSKADELENQEKNPLATQFEKYNYDSSYISGWKGVPQIYLMARYRLADWTSDAFSYETMLTLPTEKDKYSSQFVPLDFFEESPSLTQKLFYTAYSSDRYKLSGQMSYKYRTEFQKNIRIPKNSKGDFSADQENLGVRYGDEFNMGGQYDISYKKWGKFFTHLNWVHKFKDQYQGSEYSNDRYALLESETEQKMLLAGGGLQLNTIDAFLKNQFMIPMVATVQYSKVLTGKNVFDNEVYGMSLMVFYQ